MGALKTRGSVEIDRPIDEVFRLTHENIVDWSIIVVEDELLLLVPDPTGREPRAGDSTPARVVC